MKDKIKEMIKQLQDNGLPIFFIQDPLTKKPSVSLTMVVVSFTLYVLAIINKFANFLDGVNLDGGLELLITSCSLYFGRSLSKSVTKEKGE